MPKYVWDRSENKKSNERGLRWNSQRLLMRKGMQSSFSTGINQNSHRLLFGSLFVVQDYYYKIVKIGGYFKWNLYFEYLFWIIHMFSTCVKIGMKGAKVLNRVSKNTPWYEIGWNMNLFFCFINKLFWINVFHVTNNSWPISI